MVITPGSGFGSKGEGYFRISAFNSRANAEEVAPFAGIEVVKRFMLTPVKLVCFHGIYAEVANLCILPV